MSSPTWDEFAELALKRIAASGAEYGDIRIQDSSTEHIEGEDCRIASIRDIRDIGFGVRVLYHGAWGFAASSVLSLEEVPRVADLAVEIARGSASVALEKVDWYRSQFIVTHRHALSHRSSLSRLRKNDLLLNTWKHSIDNPASHGAAQVCGCAETANCSCRRKGLVWNSICWQGRRCTATALTKAGLLRAASIRRISGRL